MSGRADIIALARTLGLDTTDPVLLDRYYTEALIQFGMNTEVVLEPRFIPVVAGTATYLVPDTTGISAAFFGSRELTKTTLEHLTTFDTSYRTRQGVPRVWCEEHENHNVVRVYPVPDATSSADPIFPDPMGVDYPTDQLVVFARDRDETAAPWLDFVLANLILARDLSHQSSYRSPEVAAMATKLASITRGAGDAP